MSTENGTRRLATAKKTISPTVPSLFCGAANHPPRSTASAAVSCSVLEFCIGNHLVYLSWSFVRSIGCALPPRKGRPQGAGIGAGHGLDRTLARPLGYDLPVYLEEAGKRLGEGGVKRPRRGGAYLPCEIAGPVQ